jgi:hypothetical protein
MQYLEYLNNLLDERALHTTVRALSRKTFIVTGMSIVEAILWYVVKRGGIQKTESWHESKEMTCNEYQENGVYHRARIIMETKLAKPLEVEMTLDAMCKKAERKKLLGVGTKVYRDLHHLRDLRNRVHIHAVQHDKDTDWWTFEGKDVKLMKAALYSILTCDLFFSSAGLVGRVSFLSSVEEA